MEIEYVVAPEDIVAFYLYHFKTTRSLRRSYWMGYVSGVVAAVLFFLVFSGLTPRWSNAAFLAVFVVVYFIIYSLAVRRNITQAGTRMLSEGRNKAVLGKHRMILKENELIDANSVGESRLLWAGVENVSENETHIFIYVGTDAAHVIAKKAFESPEQAQEFYSTARNLYEKWSSG